MPNALIWGASGGIGSALVQHLKQHSWTVFAAARHPERIPTEADHTYKFDASDPETFKETALLLAEDAESLDLVVYAAGGMLAEKLDSLKADQWQTVMDANLNGAYLGSIAALHLVPEGGHIMVIGAYIDKITLPKFGAYTVAKAGLEPMLEILRKENRRKHFTLVRPPAVDTAFWENIPFNRPNGALTPQKVAEAVLNRHHSGEDGVLNL